jgi:uroporphyrinogen decarboxylase
MTGKERVLAALRKEPVDRVPIFMWFNPDTARDLAASLEIPTDALDEAMGNDVRQAWVNNNYAMEGIVHEHQGESHTDAWGITWTKDGAFNQITSYPLEHADEGAVLAYTFPHDHMEDLLANMAPVVAEAETYYIGADVSPCVFEMYWRLRGMEHGTLDLVMNRDLADTLLGRCADFAVELAEACCTRLPLDWLWTGDDVAGQQALIMSPECWRDLIGPQLKRVVDVGKRHGLPVAYHCCGALGPIIPDLIAIGVDVLNPIQCNCAGMDPLDLKAEFGAELAFMGGVDTQDLLPNGTEAEVRTATERLLDGMTADGGGYILAASHTIPPETPNENIFAMYDEAGIAEEEIRDHAADIRARESVS